MKAVSVKKNAIFYFLFLCKRAHLNFFGRTIRNPVKNIDRSAAFVYNRRNKPTRKTLKGETMKKLIILALVVCTLFCVGSFSACDAQNSGKPSGNPTTSSPDYDKVGDDIFGEQK